MEFKVRELDGTEEKSIQEKEQELLDNAEKPEPIPEESSGIKDEDVLSYIKDRYNKEITSIDQLFEERESQEELPEDVKAYYEYRKNTGRGIEDYVKLNKDFDSMDEDQLLQEFFLATEDGIDPDDVSIMMEDFSYDEDFDEEKEIKKRKLAKKKAIAQAKSYFEEQKEMYRQPLESSTVGMSAEDKEELEAYKQYIAQSKTQKEEIQKRQNWFVEKTNEVFQDFKGFDFKIGDTELTYSPGDAEEIKKTQLDSTAFVGKFLDDSGLIKDARGYHKALAVAMNPDRFAKFFYEQGKADATEDVTRKIKNVDMTDRRTPEVRRKDGVQVRAINPSEGNGLRIKSKKR